MRDILILDKVTKRYGGFIANDNICMSFKEGEIHAILGENGAGKTTLMKIIYGIHRPDSGQIFLRGSELKLKDSSESIRNGIGMVFQHFMLIPKFTAVQNIILGYEDSRFGFINYNRAREKIFNLSERYGLKVDIDRPIENLSVGMGQKIEILKVLYRNADIIIFDEPTAVLTSSEINEFMNVLKMLAVEGHTIILITHKIKEIKAVAKKCTIMRLGKVVGTFDVADTDEKMLTKLMIGKGTFLDMSKRRFIDRTNVLEIRDLNVKDERGVLKVKNISFDLREGEIFGIAGIEGSGQEELVEAILGIRDIFSGDIIKKIDGKFESIKGLSVKQIIDKKIGYIPSDRQKHGLILDFNILQNIGIKSFDDANYLQMKSSGIYNGKFEFLNTVKKQFVGFNLTVLKKISEQLAVSFDIRPRDISSKVKDLSGGNQQKVIVAREINLKPEVLLAVQPTRGLDVGAIENIYKKMMEQRDAGMTILLVSLELDELISVCDRIAVMYDGGVVGVLESDFDVDVIGKMMIGII
ncbi:ABC transporter ATP-binding protein [Borrelia anserina]|uniref:ABC transporter ATP-binding protein n=2 Tax=Borrelia anserina TaxID=143 RepID=W5SUC2_BORAN|nr:ABC transporter ATP-binding protein [Borrelia anserina]AHH08646.1 ABC transporter ATP-binding protein [Borrelia anserina BA2]APR65105.1 ribose ABC transporter ATP-binding protein [Borrelia anserina Es]UPA07031.1 ABC transporter ATP-binding protein [Borrelia anserina]